MLMNEEWWDQIEFFNKNEAWGDWSKMDVRIFTMLDDMRRFSEKGIIIHCGYEAGGHTEKSQHYLGLAVDCHFVDMPLIEQYLLAERFAWTGIGVYPDWDSPGLHLDIREKANGSYCGARWGRRIINGERKYLPINKDMINYILEK